MMQEFDHKNKAAAKKLNFVFSYIIAVSPLFHLNLSFLYNMSLSIYYTSAYEVRLKLVQNFVRYGDFKISNGRGMRSIKQIQPIFEKKLYFIILHHPAKFHRNRSRTF